MNLSDIENIFERALRIRKRLHIKDGEGMSWSYRIENNEIHKIILNGIKSPEQFEDDIESTFIWLWSLKDYVKKYSIDNGFTKKWLEAKIDSDFHLAVCADIANTLKHGGLNREGRSKRKPVLQSLKYDVPQAAISKITVRPFEVETDIKKPGLVSLTMDVLDKDGKRLGDAFKFLDYGIKAWDGIINEVEKSV